MSEIIGGEYDRVNLFGTTYMLKDAQARSDIEELEATVKDNNTYNVWVQGGFYSDGSTASTQTAIRTNVFQTFANVLTIECADGYFFVLYAWEGNTYIGMWSGSGFSTSAYARNTALDMSKIVADYPAYKYRLALRHADTTVAIAPADGTNCKFVTSKIPSYIMPVDEADMTNVITAALTKYGSVELGEGSFLINNIVMPDFTALRGQGRATKLVVGNYHTHGITAGKGCTIENLEIDGKASAVPDSKGDSAGIAIISDGSTDYYNIKISNVAIYGFNLAGIYAYKTGYWCANSVSAMNCEMRYCYAGIFCDTNAEYGRYTNVLVYGCTMGALVNGGNNKFANCDFTNNTVGFYLNAQADGTVNNGHGSCVGCTFNHSNNNAGRAIIANSVTNGYVFSGCQIHYGILYIENSAGILFDGCNFGADVSVTDYNNAAVIFEGCTFKAAPTKSGDQKAVYIDCYLLSGDAMDVTTNDLMSAVAADYESIVFPVSAGTYAWHDDTLYIAVSDIAAAEEWNASHWAEVAVGNELSSLKSAVNAINNSRKTVESLSGPKWYNGYYLSSNNQFVSNEYYRVSNSIPCTPGDTLIYHGISSQTNRWVIVWFDADGVLLSGINNMGTDYTDVEVTVPTGAEYMRVLAKADELDKTYLIYGSNAQQNPLYRIKRSVRAVDVRATALETAAKLMAIAYVDPAAASGGDGSQSAPFATINAAISAGYRRIQAKAGVQGDSFVRIEDGDFELSLWSNKSSFDLTVPDREKIIIFNGDMLTATASGNALTVAYTPRSGRRFQKVFVDKTVPPIDSSFTLAEAYNVNVFLWKYGHKARRYKPVLPEDYTGAAGTFTYQDGNIVLAPYDTDTASGLEICVSDDTGFPANFLDVGSLRLADVVILGGYFCGLQLHGCQNAEIVDCDFICTGHGDGFEAFDSNVRLQDCLGSGNAQDGFGFQHYGESAMINCDGYYNGDDGASHHRGCTGYISGGTFAGNVSGGITPAYGAKVDITGALCTGNAYGLKYLGTDDYAVRDVHASACAARGNQVDIYNNGYHVTFISCAYGTQQQAGNGTNTFY